MRVDREYAIELDKQDPLAHYRQQFVAVEEGLIYLDGNSLGRMPLASRRLVEQIAGAWGERLIRGWSDWYDLPQRLGAKIAKLIGAQEDEVIVCDSTSVNLFKLACAAVKLTGRQKLVSDGANFPSDLYLLQGVAKLFAHERLLEAIATNFMLLPSKGFEVADPANGIVDEATLRKTLRDNAALLSLSHVSFKSAYIHDMKAITDIAHDRGALMLWDLCHSVGAMPIHLNNCNVDMAVGCTYKYLNGGPGSPAFMYVRKDLQDKLVSPIWGWFGEKNPFNFDLQYEPAPGINRFLAGTPPVLSMAAIEPGLDMLIEAGMDAVREKSVKLTEYLITLYDSELEPLGFRLKTPRDSNRRGSHVSIAHPEGWRINKSLIEDMKVIPDFRHPDNIRLGVAPLYTTFEEVYEGVARIKTVVQDRLYEKHSAERATVT